MPNPSREEISTLLERIISDGVNRSLAALKDAGALDQRKMSRHYQGVGSKYYDLVTRQVEQTAKWAIPAIQDLFGENE